MFNAPPYKYKDLTKDVIVSLKVYVPFANEKERADFLRQQTAEENEENEEDGSDINMQSSDIFKNDPPDGRYESIKLEFKYTPNCKFSHSVIRKTEINNVFITLKW